MRGKRKALALMMDLTHGDAALVQRCIEQGGLAGAPLCLSQLCAVTATYPISTASTVWYTHSMHACHSRLSQHSCVTNRPATRPSAFAAVCLHPGPCQRAEVWCSMFGITAGCLMLTWPLLCCRAGLPRAILVLLREPDHDLQEKALDAMRAIMEAVPSAAVAFREQGAGVVVVAVGAGLLDASVAQCMFDSDQQGSFPMHQLHAIMCHDCMHCCSWLRSKSGLVRWSVPSLHADISGQVRD